MRTSLTCLALATLLAATCAGCANRAPAPVAPSATTLRKEGSAMLTVTSSAFTPGGRYPLRNVGAAAGGEDRSISLVWTGVPAGTRSIVVAIVDHHPVARMWVHWAVVDIPREITSLPEGASGTSAMPAGARELRNTAGRAGYAGPTPPAGTGDHDYVTTVYALGVARVDIPAAPTASDIDHAVSGHVLAQDSLTGVYSR